MNFGRSRRQLGIAAVVLVALVGAGAAFAASQLGHRTSSTGAVTGGPSFGGRGGAGFGPPGGRGSGVRPDLSTAATYLGVPVSTLQADLQAGTTLAQVADTTSGKSEAGLVAALIAAERQQLAAEVQAGRLTSSRESTLLANLRERVTAMVTARGAGGFGGPGGAPGGRPGGGFA
jgi:hypothetical protein